MVDLIDVYCIDVSIKNFKTHNLEKSKILKLSKNIYLDSLLSINPQYFPKNPKSIELIYLNKNNARLCNYLELESNLIKSEDFNELNYRIKNELKGLDYEFLIKNEAQGLDKTAFSLKVSDLFSSKIGRPVSKNYYAEEFNRSKLFITAMGGLLTFILSYLTYQKILGI
ncbi:MAG: hypothetical protein PHN56_00760 [Candidatus Nanoarchaeia archaeon]|nr:hypothetical protein [Candidatus Nanoarchaeia archaeon]